MIVVAPSSKEMYPPAVQRAFPTTLLAPPSSSYVKVTATRPRVVRTRSWSYIEDKVTQAATTAQRKATASDSEILPDGRGRHGWLSLSSSWLRAWFETLHRS